MNGRSFETPVIGQKAAKNNSTFIQLYYQNVRGLRTKTNTFYTNLLTSDYDIFAITESGLNSSIHDGEVIPPNFNILRCDRADGRKLGGVFLAASPRYELKRLPIIGNVDAALFEIICATVHRKNILLFMCCVVYIPPKSNVNEYMHLFNILETICVKFEKVIVMGDFNMPSASEEVQSYMEYVKAFCGFRQVNNIFNVSNRVLDLVLSALPTSDLEVHLADEHLVDIDAYHPPLVARMVISAHQNVTEPISDGNASNCNRWNFHKCNFNLLYNNLESIDWNRLYDIKSSEDALICFYELINCAISNCAPKRRPNLNTSRRVYPEWYTGDLIRDIRRKWRCHKLFKVSGASSDYKLFSKFRSIVKRKLLVYFNAYQKNLELNFVNDPKSFWTYVNSKKAKGNTRLTKDGVDLRDDECAECFASYFHSVYSPGRPRLDAREAQQTGDAGADAARVHVGQLTAADVCLALRKLKPKHSVGPDGIPPYIVRDCRAVFEKPLLYIFYLCLEERHYPDRWRTTRVIPVPKPGKGSDVSGFRPIAVLSAFAKIFEAALHRCIYSQVSARLSDDQYGFRPGRGAGSNLLSFVSYVAPAVDAGLHVDSAYFDFRKAFDTVDNDVLLRKFSAIGFTPHLLEFFASYLGDRRQYVEYAGYCSRRYNTWSGVSQGSNLGTLSFIIMINDLPEVVKESKCSLFADDLKLFRTVQNTSDCERLQRDIDRVVMWSEANKLFFNVEKCCMISYSRKRAPLEHQYIVGGAGMPRVARVRDLGIEMVPDLSYRTHINNLCTKSFRNLGFILRQTSKSYNVKVSKVLYNSLVRSQLEYNSIIWNPHEAKYTQMIEKIQNKLTRYLYLKEYGVYPGYPHVYPSQFVLGMVRYCQLSVRKDMALVKYVCRVLRGELHHPEFLEALQLRVPDNYVGLRRRPAMLSLPSSKTKLLNESPMLRAIRLLNKLSDNHIDIFAHNLPKLMELVLGFLRRRYKLVNVKFYLADFIFLFLF
ncbi:unnamed protein product [Euphydryas editha]|uniref:Reverse transcriptase domain-containing protein n=1 Tax=Euphydryas editha TaxID=104508 RepID=A0AAU9UYK9_EUPED|nr:unnamed protein product [Euphydryas editha]